MRTENRSSTRTPLTAVIATGILLVVVVLLVFSYASPYLVLSRLRDAAQARDAQTINHYVDYPALRASLKQQITQMLSRRVDEQKLQHPFAALGALFGIALVSPLVDAYATPDGVAALLAGMPPRGEPGEVPPSPNDEQTAQSGQTPPSQEAPVSAPAAAHPVAPRAGGSAGYRDINTFAVTYTRGTAEEPYSVIFHRRGWFSWQIDAVDLNP
ncbi:MAG: DUF2939 domain-containing protein [Trinickia sp.]|jgi:hypothetical protein